MRILVREEEKTIVNIWVPSGPAMLRFILRFVPVDNGRKLSKDLRDRLIETYKKIRKYHKNLVIADITSKDGTKVFIKL